MARRERAEHESGRYEPGKDESGGHDMRGQELDRQGLEFFLPTFVRPVVLALVFLGFHLFWRGHNAPGGGFIAGLVVAVAALLSRIAFRHPFLHVAPERLLPWGLLLALLPGVVPMLFGGAFLKSAYGYLTWPLVGEFEWASAVVFDAGVFLVVIGTTLTIIERLADDPEVGLEAQGERPDEARDGEPGEAHDGIQEAEGA